MNSTISGELDKQNWMSKVLDIGRLKLTDVIWPGTHNCGMDKKAAHHDALRGNWTTCQNDSFAWQLANGARAFDIRLGYSNTAQSSAFYFHHNGYQSGRTLEELISAVISFLANHPHEFIVLDFHELADGEKPFDYQRLNDVLIERLGDHVIPSTDAHLTVEQLKRKSPRRRVVMAAAAKRELDEDVFWPFIWHKWSGKRFADTDDLHSHVKTTLERTGYPRVLWSLSATSYSLLGGPQHIKNQINDWFDTTRDWVTRCSIINTDFFEESDIVRLCWSATSMKAVYGDSLLTRG
ncbi:phospholipase [Pseudomonas sp. PB103]|uniref:phospholipase n=1 Tax=Pseudomonas sp. PB103 TaxID=2494698 RepID=UPI00131A7426|nr:phospholipase [Pseudomonas sp. PB103]KAE9642002.1 phospholipase [Pseudomonas sp. PB103]